MATITGTDDPESINGTVDPDTITGLDGDDFIRGLEGADTIDAGDGDDTVRGGAGSDTIYGGAGNDSLYGAEGNTTLGLSGNDKLYGGDGDDFLRGGTGADTYDGGAGSDRVSFYFLDATQAVVVDLRTQTVQNDGYGHVEHLTSIEGVGDGTIFADTFTGNDDAGVFLAGKGDYVYGLGGDDSFQFDDAPAYVNGGDGIDTLIGWSGTRLVDTDHDGIAEIDANGPVEGVIVDLHNAKIFDDGWGNAGTIVNVENVHGYLLDDILTGNGVDNILWGEDGNDLIDGYTGNDTLYGGTGDDHLIGNGGADTIYGDDGNDLVYGGTNSDTIDGGAGDDTLYGDDGTDSIAGGDGNDVIYGGTGSDTLVGGLGDDVITGGAGRDTLVGNGGADTFVFTAPSDSPASAPDVIVDLSAADIIDLSAIDADVNTAGDQAFSFVSAFDGHAGEATMAYVASAGRTVLSFDTNGDSIADMSIYLTGNQMAFTNFHP